MVYKLQAFKDVVPRKISVEYLFIQIQGRRGRSRRFIFHSGFKSHTSLQRNEKKLSLLNIYTVLCLVLSFEKWEEEKV